MATTWVPTDTFGLRLRLIRVELGATVDEIAAQCGVRASTWVKWERGAQPRGMDQVVRAIVDATGVDRDWLMWGGPLRSRCLALWAS